MNKQKKEFYWTHVFYINLDQAHAVNCVRSISYFIQQEARG